jgi:hypothetical protein
MLHKILATLCVLALVGVLGADLAYSRGATKDGLVEYWSFDAGTFDKKKLIGDWAGTEAIVIGDPELAARDKCKVNECVLFDGDLDYFLVDDKNKVFERDFEQISFDMWWMLNALDDSWNRITSLDNTAAGNSAVASMYYDDNDDRHNFWIRGDKGNTDAAVHDLPGDPPLEVFEHWAGVYNGTSIKLYKDAKVVNKYDAKFGKLSKDGLLMAIGDRTDG